jgi:hypothetical protein
VSFKVEGVSGSKVARAQGKILPCWASLMGAGVWCELDDGKTDRFFVELAVSGPPAKRSGAGERYNAGEAGGGNPC